MWYPLRSIRKGNLFNNAKVTNLPTLEISVDGLEMNLATNYVGGMFFFTNTYLGKIATGGRQIMSILSNG